jgi:hypothetical protein
MFHRHHRYHRFARARLLTDDDLRRHHRRSHLVFGGALVAFGLAWLLQGWGLIAMSEVWLAAPVVLVGSGLVRLARDRSAASVVRALIRFALAAYLFVVIEQVGGLTWAATWPVLLIAAGLATVVDALLVRARAGEDEEAAW